MLCIEATLQWIDREADGVDGKLVVRVPRQLTDAALDAFENSAAGTIPDVEPAGGALQAFASPDTPLDRRDADDEEQSGGGGGSGTSAAPVASVPLADIIDAQLAAANTMIHIKRRAPATGAELPPLFLQLVAEEKGRQVPTDGENRAGSATHIDGHPISEPLRLMFRHIRYFLRYHAVTPAERAEMALVSTLRAEIAASESRQLAASGQLHGLRQQGEALRLDTLDLNDAVVELRTKLQRLCDSSTKGESIDKERDETSALRSVSMGALSSVLSKSDDEGGEGGGGGEKDAENSERDGGGAGVGTDDSGKKRRNKKRRKEKLTADELDALHNAIAELLPSEDAAEALVALQKELAEVNTKLAAVREFNTALQQRIDDATRRRDELSKRSAELTESIRTQREHRNLTSTLVADHLRNEQLKLSQRVSEARAKAAEVTQLEATLAAANTKLSDERRFAATLDIEAEVAAARDALKAAHSGEMRAARRKLKEREDQDVEAAIVVRRLHEQRVGAAKEATREAKKAIGAAPGTATAATRAAPSKSIVGRGSAAPPSAACSAQAVAELEQKSKTVDERIASLRALRTRLAASLATATADANSLEDENEAFRVALAPLQEEHAALAEAVGISQQHAAAAQAALVDLRRDVEQQVELGACELDAMYADVTEHRARELRTLRAQHAELNATMEVIVRHDRLLRSTATNSYSINNDGDIRIASGKLGVLDAMVMTGADVGSLQAVAAASADQRALRDGAVSGRAMLAAMPADLRRSMLDDL